MTCVNLSPVYCAVCSVCACVGGGGGSNKSKDPAALLFVPEDRLFLSVLYFIWQTDL